MPQVSTLTGRAKFVTSGERGAHRQAPLGYEVEILLEPYEKFPCSVVPQFTFILKDKDGFQIATLKGEPHDDDVFGGVKTLLRGTTTGKVSAADARATKSIECEILCELVIPPLQSE